MLTIQLSYAGSATWSQDAANGDWNEPTNWVPATVPNGPADTATFSASNLTSVSISRSADEQISGITFDISASGFTITTSAVGSYFLLTMSGAGIVNNSGIKQHFVADRPRDQQAQLRFMNSSTAGSSTTFTNNGGNFVIFDPFIAAMEFFDMSTAGNGTFVNNPGSIEGAVSGYVAFEDNATAGHGTFVNNGGGSFVQGASTRFSGNASAGQGAFLNNGATASGFQSYFNSGYMTFVESSTAGNASVTNNGGLADRAVGGSVVFGDASTAGSATFTNNPGEVNGAFGGYISFGGSAGNGTFTNNGSLVSGAYGGAIEFYGGTGGNGRFLNKRGMVSGALGSVIRFYDAATADQGDFTNEGGSFANQGGGYVRFKGSSTAGSSTFTNDGGTVSGALGGSTDFLESSTAANATLVANGGSNGGQGGQFQFAADATGGTARVMLFENGFLTISAHNPPGVTTGSLEGSGNVLLGNNNLTVGSNNRSTSFSGVIQNGGSLTKIGTGMLTLSGANIYTGLTTINGGKLEVDGSIMSAVTVNNGGTLAGSGMTGSVTVNSGGTVAPGDSQTLHINGNYAQNAGGVVKVEVAGTDPNASGRLDITGSATLDGTLEVRFVNGFFPASGQVFKLLNVGGAFAGSFPEIIFPDLRAGFQFQGEFVNGSYQITALNDGEAATGFLNISTRMRVGTGDNALIGGFIVTGTEAKRVILRALGPSLGGFGVPGVLADPTLELHDGSGAIIATDDDWKETQQAEIEATGLAPANDLESAIVRTLDPGAYTAIVRGKNNSTGVGLVEAYDLAQAAKSQLGNISTRGFVETGDNVMIGGFIAGNQAMHVMVRAIGPSLTQFGVPDALVDPTLELHNAQGAIIAFNNDWQDTDAASIEATGIPPTNAKESAILAILVPGNYTAIVRGLSNTTGVGLVEVYDLP